LSSTLGSKSIDNITIGASARALNLATLSPVVHLTIPPK
jgi:hypothetical protein